ncbi:MAG: hypothetical protein HRU80_01535 [Ignavibacteriales bacterium]|nr:MAG: hypothetical protein HRU80_01535 [Ignavibacteriales bacterium]
MQNILLFENNTELNSRIRTQLTESGSVFRITGANTTEELISVLTSGRIDAAIIDFDELGSLFKMRPYILRHISGKARMFFLSSEVSPMMTLNFSILRFMVFHKKYELKTLVEKVAEGEVLDN